MKPPVMIMHVTGTNRDRETAWACELAGGSPEIVLIEQLLAGERKLLDYHMLVLPGGFSYGDDLGAGKLWAVILRHKLADDLAAFIAAGRPVLGICNGFQALVKSGLLPGIDGIDNKNMASPTDKGPGAPAITHNTEQMFTLMRNDSNRFECRWVYLRPQPDSHCIFIHRLEELIYCPVAHGEGKFVTRKSGYLANLESLGLVALRYVNDKNETAGYPWNPNGSHSNIAGICNPQGTILGLMPHPEDHLIHYQHPRYHRGERGMLGLPLFQNGIRYSAAI